MQTMNVLQDLEIWIIDTGATCHSTGNGIGMINMKPTKSKTTVNNGQQAEAKAVGDIPFTTSDGLKGTMKNVKVIKGSPFNLISGTKLLTLGFEMRGGKGHIECIKDDLKLRFDIKVMTPEGMVLATRLKRTATELGVAMTDKVVKTMSIQEAHEQFGHMSEEATRATAKALGITITRGTLKPCESCAIGKAKQKKVATKAPKEKSDKSNGRVYLDVSRIIKANAS